MQVEIFDAGRATGRLLLLQIKGTERLPEGEEYWAVDVPVRLVRYAELFSVPLLLCVCSVRLDRPEFRFLWLQEYIRVVLDTESVGWRSNSATVRVQIPHENIQPGSEGRLRFMAGFPRRLADFGQLARIQHELRREFAVVESSNTHQWRKCIDLLVSIQEFGGIFGEPGWDWPTNVLMPAVKRGLAAAEALQSGLPFAPHALRALGIDEEGNGDPESRAYLLRSCVHRAVEVISSGIAIFHDHRLRYATWKSHGDHDF